MRSRWLISWLASPDGCPVLARGRARVVPGGLAAGDLPSRSEDKQLRLQPVSRLAMDVLKGLLREIGPGPRERIRRFGVGTRRRKEARQRLDTIKTVAHRVVPAANQVSLREDGRSSCPVVRRSGRARCRQRSGVNRRDSAPGGTRIALWSRVMAMEYRIGCSTMNDRTEDRPEGIRRPRRSANQESWSSRSWRKVEAQDETSPARNSDGASGCSSRRRPADGRL